jgi:MFS family permease
MAPPRTTSPLAIFFLVLPYGISSGFASVTLPFALTQAGFPVAVSASIVAIGISSNIWRFLWGPVADLTLSPRRWYLLGLGAGAVTLLLAGLMPLRTDAAVALTAVVFLSQVAATLVVLPVGGLMAHTVPDAEKGRAGGWYQAGNLGGSGLGGGAGVWLVAHFSTPVAAAVLAAMMAACALALFFVPAVTPRRGGSDRQKVPRDRHRLPRPPALPGRAARHGARLIAGRLGRRHRPVGPLSAADWRASADTVALVTGILSGVVSAVGCVIGGWIADRIGRWWSYFGSGALMAAITIAMALAPRTPATYSAGVLLYALACGMCYAAFSALLLYVIGRGAASTKYATLSSLGNLPTSYMTAFDGWAHDRWGAAGMLHGEAGLGLAFVGLLLFWLGRIRGAPARTHEPALG